MVNSKMSDSSPVDNIRTLVALTEQMLELAQANAWAEVVALESRRRSQLENLFESLSKAEKQSFAEQLRQGIERILDLDQKITELGKVLKDKTAMDLREKQSALKAANIYKDNSAL